VVHGESTTRVSYEDDGYSRKPLRICGEYHTELEELVIDLDFFEGMVGSDE